jgi:hypothetical protein
MATKEIPTEAEKLPIILDHPIPDPDLQTTVLHLTEQVKQLQRELGVQIGKFNERVRPMETFLKNEEKKRLRFEEARRGLRMCGTGRMMMEQRKREEEKEKKDQEIDELLRGFGMFGTGRGRRAVEKNNPAVIVCPDRERFRVKNDKEMGESSGRRGEGEEMEEGNRPGRVGGSCQALHESLEKQK